MIQQIRKSRISKIIASYLAIQLIVQTVQPFQLYALTSGPSQPEFNAFTPIGTSDMVNLSSGDFNYNIPVMDVGGYPLNLAYDSGITMDQEASWVGLGWNLNVGQISRQVRGLPDDFKGDLMTYENDMKPNTTVGTAFKLSFDFFGKETTLNKGTKDETTTRPGELSLGLGVQYNNYEGITFKPSYGISYDINDNIQIGADFSSSVADGVTVTPQVNFSKNLELKTKNATAKIMSESSLGVAYNSRQGLSSFNLGSSMNKKGKTKNNDEFKGKLSSGFNYSFSTPTITPSKRIGMKNENYSFRAAAGITIMGTNTQTQIDGSVSIQKVREKKTITPAFGYEHTSEGDGANGVLDFNREKDRSFNKHTTVAPITNYTYDVYALQGQGIQGTFRPFQSQVGLVYDTKVEDKGVGVSAGAQFGGGNAFYTGIDISVTDSDGSSGIWGANNFAGITFLPDNSNTIDYEPTYFKMAGSLDVDNDLSIFEEKLQASAPIGIEIGGSRYNRVTQPIFNVKKYSRSGRAYNSTKNISGKIKRSHRSKRNQNIVKVTNEEALQDPFITHKGNDLGAKEHHTVGMKVLKPDGSTYIFGKSAYNTSKVETTFDVSGRNDYDCTTGLVGYDSGNIKGNGSNSSDLFFNRITTPSYAHTYLLTSILSSDYEDVSYDGPTDDDLGTYTKFHYKTYNDKFGWRIPYQTNKASFNEGLKSNPNDQKGNYIYGQKELMYIDKIETKTHIAIFDLSPRKDGRGVTTENGSLPGTDEQEIYKINTIKLYSKPEYIKYSALLEDNNPDNDPPLHLVSPIKTAHFEYDYSQCKNVKNNLGGSLDQHELSNDGGKLTLKKVYFTYRESNMGKYNPYVFNYDGFNPDYNLKGYDIWGNYKSNSGNGCTLNDPITTAEFPFVKQDKSEADQNTTAWTLTSIDLPSGGKMEIQTEADDYQFVQNRKAMQMFKVVGAGLTATPLDPERYGTQLYSKPNNAVTTKHHDYIYVKISDEELDLSKEEFVTDYLGDLTNSPVYFNFLLNMVNKTSKYDYVSGYFRLKDNSVNNIEIIRNGGTYVSLPLKMLEREGGWVNSNKPTNPIAKAGWYFGRTYLNRLVYSVGGEIINKNAKAIVEDLVGSLGQIASIFRGPNGKLQEKKVAQSFNPEKSWIRLYNPNGRKFGGGLRVKKIQLHDQWDVMTNNLDNPLYKQFYGQEYDYTNDDGLSSGVATFEPNGSKENPFVEPFYDDKGENANEKLAAPKEFNYIEKPIGESFFPSASVTYSKVTVKNLDRKEGDRPLVSHATGKVVNTFYTTKDFPTITDQTEITKEIDLNKGALSILTKNLNNRSHLTFSQGFVVETNDMNGKAKSQKVYAEGQDKPISGMDYSYSIDRNNRLNNLLPTINADGVVSNDKLIGIQYDVINDFRENKTNVKIGGVNANVSGFFAAIIPGIVPVPLPVFNTQENLLRIATTTKVVHRSGILVAQKAYDLGAEVTTKNLAWDAETGQVLLTETVNEYNDQYYNFNFPAHWHYSRMGLASKNIGITGTLSLLGNNTHWELTNGKANEHFALGDELRVHTDTKHTNLPGGKLWVVGFNSDGNGVLLMNGKGTIASADEDFVKDVVQGDLSFKIVRSGYRNQQSASMASVTMMKNPIRNVDGSLKNLDSTSFVVSKNSTLEDDLRIINSSAVEYSDLWKSQCECGLPNLNQTISDNEEEAEAQMTSLGFNPYVYNVKGEWRAKASYAYLTSRRAGAEASPRIEGFYQDFRPFYVLENGSWKKSNNIDKDWTFASEISQYSPYGVELENRDALDRYSSAQFGYNYTLATAVASNSQYREMGVDNFEDYNYKGNGSEQQGENFNTEGHFDYREIVNADGDEGIQITNERSHTGQHSLLVPPKKDASLHKVLVPQPAKPLDSDNDGIPDEDDYCPFTPNKGNNQDSDGDGIGDACDDEVTPRIPNLPSPFKVITPQYNNNGYGCFGRTAIFEVHGEPNQKVGFQFKATNNGTRGWKAHLNSRNILEITSQISPNIFRGEIQLDVTGKHYMKFDLNANPRRRLNVPGVNNNVVEMSFSLLNKSGNPIGEIINLRAVANKHNCN